jgi:hypothetical protein
MPADAAMRSAVFTSLARAGLSKSSKREIVVTPNSRAMPSKVAGSPTSSPLRN